MVGLGRAKRTRSVEINGDIRSKRKGKSPYFSSLCLCLSPCDFLMLVLVLCLSHNQEPGFSINK